MQKPATVFLMYHELGLGQRDLSQSEPRYPRYVIPVAEFEAQMASLKASGLRGVTVTEALQFASPAVAITFDDGCETDLVAAAPVLQKFGLGATFFVIPGFLGNRSYMSREQMRELSDAGFEIGCHSMTHPCLTDLDDAGLQREIHDAKITLEQITGKAVEHFSCPGGDYDARIIQVAKASGYRSMATSGPRANSHSSDPFTLGRVPIKRGLKPASFQKLCRGRTLWKLNLQVGVQAGARSLLGDGRYYRLRAAILKK